MGNEKRIVIRHPCHRTKVPHDLDPTRIYEGFESPKAADERRSARIACLVRGDTLERHLAKKLSRCRPRTCCASPACPICMRQLRRWWPSAILTSLRRLELPVEPLILTLVDPRWAASAGELHAVCLHKIADTVSKRFDRHNLGDAIVLGGFDFDLVVTDNDPDSRTWQPHLHLVIANVLDQDLKPFLQSYRRQRCPSVPRPVTVSRLNHPVSQLCYLLKGEWCRRSRYLEHRADRKGPTRNTRKQALKSSELRELLTFLDRHSLTDLIFRKRVRLYGSRFVAQMSATRQFK